MQGQENVRGGPGWATCPQEEMILGILEMSGTPQKPKMGNCYIRTSRDVGKTCQKLAENENIPFSHSCPLGPSRVLLMTKGGYGRHGLEVCKVRKMPRDDQLEQHFLGRESILGVLEMPGDPLEPLNQIKFRCGLDIKSSKFPGKTKYYIDFIFELITNDLIWFDASEEICLVFQSWYTCHLCARQLHQFQIHAGRTVWDAATNFVQPVCCWENNLLKM